MSFQIWSELLYVRSLLPNCSTGTDLREIRKLSVLGREITFSSYKVFQYFPTFRFLDWSGINTKFLLHIPIPELWGLLQKQHSGIRTLTCDIEDLVQVFVFLVCSTRANYHATKQSKRQHSFIFLIGAVLLCKLIKCSSHRN